MLGGMERLNWHMADELAKAADVRAIAPKGSAAQAPSSVQVDEIPISPLWSFLLLSAIRAIRVAKHWKPDVVLAGSGLTAPAAWVSGRLTHARACAYVHGLDLAVEHVLYRRLWRPVLRRLDHIVANSSATLALGRAIGIAPERMTRVCPGVTMPPPTVTPDELTAFRQQHRLPASHVLIAVGRLTARKGLAEFVEYGLPSVIEAIPDVVFLIVGEAPTQALRAAVQTPDDIRAAARRAGVETALRFAGPIHDRQQLSVAYGVADVHVFPVREVAGDPEGFGMVTLEAAAHGLPTAAFQTGGIRDAVANRQSGQLLRPGDYLGLSRAIVEMIGDTRAWTTSSVSVAEQATWTIFGRMLLEVMEYPSTWRFAK
ncbi:glycosyltransferase family 4 protein [Abyssibacter sp.]